MVCHAAPDVLPVLLASEQVPVPSRTSVHIPVPPDSAGTFRVIVPQPVIPLCEKGSNCEALSFLLWSQPTKKERGVAPHPARGMIPLDPA